jgi:hypothetical protein
LLLHALFLRLRLRSLYKSVPAQFTRSILTRSRSYLTR